MRKALLLVMFFALASFLIEGKFLDYGFFPIHGTWKNNDQTLVIPAAYLSSGKGFFEKDFAINAYLNAYPSVIFKILGLSFRFFGSMLMGYMTLLLVLKLIFVISTFFLAERIIGNERTALIATFALSMTHFMGVEEIGVSEVVAKSFAFAFFPALVYFFLKGMEKEVFASLGLMTYVHALSSLPLFLAFSTLLLREKRKGAIIPIVIFIALSLPFMYGNFVSEKPDIAFLKETAPYASAVNGMLPILKYLPIIALGLWGMRKNGLLFFSAATLAYSSISIFSIFSDSFVPYSLFRAAKFAIYLSFIFAFPALLELVKNKHARFAVMALIIFPFSSIHYSNIFSADLPEVSDAIKVGGWISEHSGREDVIAIPAEWPSLRGWSARSAVIGGNDLWIGAVKPSVKDELLRRHDAKKYDEMKGYGARYVVTYKNKLEKSLLFESGNFRVYE